MKTGAKVEVLEQDDGSGAATVRYGGRTWVVDSQRLR
jgi:hypothetical protein